MVREDAELLREYVKTDSEAAFADLVSRYIDLVYSVATRQVGDAHLAEDITQTVFIVLARKAKTLRPGTVLPGWLCRTARYVAADTLKRNRRRQCREQQSHLHAMSTEAEAGLWDQIAPLLDEGLSSLGNKEHDALVLRFFHGKELKCIGAAMGTTEDGARMRVQRGLEGLRHFFQRRGLALSTSAIAAAVGANSVQAAPAGLASGIIATAISSPVAATAGLAVIEKGLAMTTMQKTVVAAAFVVASGLAVYEARQSVKLEAEVRNATQQRAALEQQLGQLRQELGTLREENEGLNRRSAEVFRLRGRVGELERQLAVRTMDPPRGTDTPASGGGVWRLREPRGSSDFQNRGMATPEAAAETILWAARQAPRDLIQMVHLSDESRRQYGGDSSAAADFINRLAARIRGYTQGPGNQERPVWLEGGERRDGIHTLTALDDTQVVTNTYDQVVGFEVTSREDLNDQATETFQEMLLYKINGQWKLVLPGTSPSTR